MAASRITISIDKKLLRQLDHLVAKKRFASRSQAIQAAVQEMVVRLKRVRLAKECARADPAEEKAMAEDGMWGELAQWPRY